MIEVKDDQYFNDKNQELFYCMMIQISETLSVQQIRSSKCDVLLVDNFKTLLQLIHYMFNSHKSITPLKPKKLNLNTSHGSLTPKYHSILNSSHSQLSQINPTHSSNIKNKICTCKKPHACNHSSCWNGGGVSYSQLQIILQNIQKIKDKANKDLCSYQKTIGIQQSLIKQMQLKLNRYQNIQQTIKTERQIIRDQFKTQICSKTQQIQVYKQSIANIQQQNKTLTSQLLQLKNINNNQQQNLQTLKKQKQKYQKNYQYLSKSLKISHEDQIVNMVNKKYSSLAEMCNYVSNIEMKLEQQINKNKQYKNDIEQFKERIGHSQKMEEHFIQQIRSLQQEIGQSKIDNKVINDKIKEYQAKIDQLQQQLRQKQQINYNKTRQYEQKISNISHDYEQTIYQLQMKIRILETEVKKVVDVEVNNKNQDKFKAIVDAVCDDSEDYQNIVKRLQYLEKFRNQHYFMVNKIQFLCRLLDQS